MTQDFDKVLVFTLYQDNIDPQVIQAHKAVFEYLSIPIEYIKFDGGDTKVAHGLAINKVVDNHIYSDYQYFLHFDIDCIPLNKEIILEAFLPQIKNDKLIGCAQKANHLPYDHVYAGACALGFSRKLYNDIGRPTFAHTKRGDTAEELTYACEARYEEPIILMPTACEIPKWQLTDTIQFGNGTTYNDSIYHAFEIRSNQQSKKLFLEKCKEVISVAYDFTIVHPVTKLNRDSLAYRSILAQNTEARVQLLIIYDKPKIDNDVEYSNFMQSLLQDTVPKNMHVDVMSLPYNSYSNVMSAPGGIPRSIGSSLARGKYVCYLDEDNTYAPNHIDSLFQASKTGKYDVLFSLRFFVKPEETVEDNFESLGPNEGINPQGFIDTNCYAINRLTMWNCFGGWCSTKRNDDRIIFMNLQSMSATFKCTHKHTVRYTVNEPLLNNELFWQQGLEYVKNPQIYRSRLPANK